MNWGRLQMTPERLLEHFERIADAPDAVDRLRQFVLNLAVRGKLVPQDASDKPAPDFDKTIPKKIERPFCIPATWHWSRLRSLGKLKGGGTPSKAEGDFWGGHIPWVSPKDMKIDHLSEAQLTITDSAIKNSAATLIEPGSVLFVVRGMILAHSFPVAVTRVPLTINQDMKALVLMRPEMAEFVLRALKGLKPEVLACVQRSTHGTCRLEGSDYADFMIPIPPAAEQNRIVAKVDELMALCDRLEAARVVREATRDRLAAAGLARLNVPDSPSFRDDARFVLRALPALTTRTDQIRQIRQTILNLAVRGKLVPQYASDGPASIFDKTIPSEIEAPFSIPATWNWSRLRFMGKLKGGGTPSKADGDFWGGDIPWVSPKDMKIDHLSDAQLKITKAAIKGSAATLIEQGSVLFVVRGMILAHSFPVAVTRVPLVVNQDMKALVLRMPEMAEFVMRALKGLKPEMLARVKRSTHGTCRLEGSDYSDFMIPVPPAAEQSRIVAKVDELMALCDRLEASLSAGEQIRRSLLEALLSEALDPDTLHVQEAA
jgi:type I restriction enzyme, S subunit